MGTPNTAFVKQFQDTVTMLVQQSDSRLRGCVMVDTNFKGEKKFYEQYATDSMVELSSRYADTPVQLPDHRRRMVTPRYYVSNTLEDPKDALQMLIDPKSTYMQAKQAAANRQIDDIIIAAFNATAYTGQEGSTTQAFDASNQVSVNTGATNSGMNKAKVLRAKRLLDAAEVDDNERYAVASARQFEDLLNITEVTSSDYNVVKALVEGSLNTWVGFAWKRSARLGTSNSNRLCYFWQKKAMQLAIQKDVEGRVDERADKNYALQVYMKLCMGATRLEESRIVEVACAEA
jgi:hypothetical protein